MSLCWLLIGDGRDEVHERSLASYQEMLPAPDKTVVVDDSDHELGFAGAIQKGWSEISGCDFVAHLELDFLIHRPIPVDRILSVLKRHPYLAQICLKRQPVNEQETELGGIVECRPDDYTQRLEHGDIWTENRVCFSTNPSFYPAALVEQGWPQTSESEGVFTHRLLQAPEVRFAFWGAKYDDPLVEHVGVRVGTGY